MTEVPEHLLKRSQERRKALGLPAGDEGSAPAAALQEPAVGEVGDRAHALVAFVGRRLEGDVAALKALLTAECRAA